MSRVCQFTGKRTIAGRSIARRGKAKYLGGVGRKITGVTKRKFKPNIQKASLFVWEKMAEKINTAQVRKVGGVKCVSM